jgi:hypothetical protein
MESGKFVEIPWEMIDQIVVDELKQGLEMNLVYANLEEDRNEYDSELVSAIKKVMTYYMTKSDYDDYMFTIGETDYELTSDTDIDAA